MPPRLNRTAEEIREQTRLRVKRYRERRNATVTAPGNVTGAVLPARTNGPARARSLELEVTSFPTEKRESTTDFEQVRCVLEPLRGYVHDERLLERLATTCPAVDLVLEAIGMAEWLNRTANRKRVCSKAFVSNWVKRAATKPSGRTEPAERPRSALGRVLQQIATDPVAGPSTWH